MKISVGRENTVNIGNFSNVKPYVKVEDDVKEDEDVEECYLRLSELCNTLFEAERKKAIKKEENRGEE